MSLERAGRELAERQQSGRLRRIGARSVGIIVDTCIWVALSAGELDRGFLANVTGEASIFVSVITLGELSFGVQSLVDPAERAVRATYLRRLEDRPTLNISPSTAAAFGALAAAVKNNGRSPRRHYNDLWIAAQAIENGFSLLTTNTKDFTGLPGLELLNPLAH